MIFQETEAPEPTAPTEEEEVEEPAIVAAAPAFHASAPGAATEAATPAIDSTPPAGQQVTQILAAKNPPQFIIEMTESSCGRQRIGRDRLLAQISGPSHDLNCDVICKAYASMLGLAGAAQLRAIVQSSFGYRAFVFQLFYC